MTSKPFSEVIESSLHHFQAQTWQWDQFPAYGSLVCVDQKPYTIMGLVSAVSTDSIDPSRSPFAYQKTEEELKKEQPQIFEFLKTTFKAVLLGYQHHERWHYIGPSYPAKVHAFVREATPQEQRSFLANERYLHRLFNISHQVDSIDELLIAMLCQANSTLSESNSLGTFLSQYALLTGNDYRRIKLFLQQLEPALRMQKTK